MKTPEEIEKLALSILTKEYEKFGQDNMVNVGVPKIHIDNWVKGYTQSQQDNTNDKYTFKELTDEILVENVCLSFRHDFGLMNNEEREKLRFECKEWLRALFNNQHLLKK
ncbi:MAG: hypothetical protein IPJ01_11225 [Micavibrio sp.]|nr:hypothetical protein [Micavibrio sp.]